MAIHDLSLYDGCVYGKHRHTTFLWNGDSYAKSIVEIVHINLCGSMTRIFHEKAKKLTFIDDYFMKTFIYIMKIKFGLLNKLTDFKTLLNQIGKKSI
jgi:hypothetical protein